MMEVGSCSIAQVFCGTPAIGEAVVGHVATVGHSQDKTTTTEYGVAHVFFRERRYTFRRWESKAIAVLSLPAHQHGFSVNVDLDATRIETTLDTHAFGGGYVGVASEAMNKEDAIE